MKFKIFNCILAETLMAFICGIIYYLIWNNLTRWTGMPTMTYIQCVVVGYTGYWIYTKVTAIFCYYFWEQLEGILYKKDDK